MWATLSNSFGGRRLFSFPVSHGSKKPQNFSQWETKFFKKKLSSPGSALTKTFLEVSLPLEKLNTSLERDTRSFVYRLHCSISQRKLLETLVLMIMKDAWRRISFFLFFFFWRMFFILYHHFFFNPINWWHSLVLSDLQQLRKLRET